jgi:predicted Zn-dependent protease
MHHMDAKKRNAGIGAVFGAIIDIAAATQGVNTGGGYTNQMAQLGAMTFSQDFEREADYVGLYILARSGHSIRNAPNLWRRMATESPGSIKFASGHPTTAERYVRLETYITEIERKQASGAPLLPELKKK